MKKDVAWEAELCCLALKLSEDVNKIADKNGKEFGESMLRLTEILLMAMKECTKGEDK